MLHVKVCVGVRLADSVSSRSAEGSDFALHCRGDVRLYRGEDDCTPKSKKGRALLAILAAEERPLTRVKIIDLLWSERQEEQARASLRTLLADLKQQFGEQFEEVLDVDRERIALAPSVRTDLKEPSLGRPTGELFEGLDHIDPQLDEWLRAERQRWPNVTAPPAGATRPGQPPPKSRRFLLVPVLGVVLVLLIGAIAVSLTAQRSSAGAQRERVNEARALLDRGSPAAAEQARRLLIRVVQVTPNDGIALATLAESTMGASDHPGIGGPLPHSTAKREARAYSMRAIELNPRQASAWAALGFSHYATAEAVMPLQKAVELDPNKAKYRWQLARALEYENRYDEAYLHARRAIELDRRDPEPVIGLLRAAAQLGREEEMKAAVEAYGRRGPAPADMALVNGYLAYQLNDEPACIRNLEPLVVKGAYRPISTLVSCLTALGEKRRAVELSGGIPSFRSDILRDDVSAVERRARSMGREFWLRNVESLAAADLLVRADKSQALVASFDASYDSVAEFEREGGRVAMEPMSILLAMRQAGRVKDAQQLRNILVKQAKDQSDGMGESTWSLFAKASVALADGEHDRSVSLLEQCFPDCFVGYYNMDISQSAFFAQLKGHQRFDRLILRYRHRINVRRKQAGLPALAAP